MSDVNNNKSASDDVKIQQAIKNYLLKHPSYFSENPDLVTALEVVTTEGKLTDLTTHQMRALKQENGKLKTQISQLIKNAKLSESMMDRLFKMLTELSVAPKGNYLSVFADLVEVHFPVEYFKLLVTKEDENSPDHKDIEILTTTQMTQFSVFQAKSEPLSGRLKQEKIMSIFTGVEDIKSAIVFPIGTAAEFGLLAFASRDEEKFHPNSSSDLLQKLSQILATYFSHQKLQNETQGSVVMKK